uniref:C2H2-type domain-containing protein n=1 Tax=Caenorhabditis tropicalis TaxID=1561998 RepID=A0A1I7URR2_9PELO
MMSEGREIQAMTVVDDDYLNRAFPVTDDECSDEEIAPHPFRRTETLETVRRRRLKKFGSLNPESDAKHVLWWENARDELLTIRAIENHCVKVTGESSEPFGKFEEYMGKPENGEKVRDRMMESRRVPKTRPFDIKRESDLDDGQLLTVPASDPFKDCRVKRTPQTIGLNSLLLQNMRRKCIDEFLLLLMIIKGQQMLQDGNVIRCLAYIMLIEYKLAVFHENAEFSPIQNNNFYPYLTQLHKKLLSKFRLYSTDIFGLSCTTPAEESTLLDEETEHFNALCEIFVQETRAYFFCICLRGKAVEHKPGTPSMKELDRTEIEQQHEFFFGLDQINKNNHLYSFWRTECMPIVTGLLCMIDHTLVDRIDSMDSARAAKHIDDFPGLSPSTREWVKQVTRYGYTKQKTRTEPKYNGPLIQSVPMLFQLPSRNNDENRADYMMEPEDLERVHEATTDFVREKHNSWRRDCRIDKENVGKTNRDLGYNEQQDLMFFGEAIEKDVYMVAAYRGEHFSEEGEEIAEKLHLLCRKMRSQAGFIITKTCHDAEDKSD